MIELRKAEHTWMSCAAASSAASMASRRARRRVVVVAVCPLMRATSRGDSDALFNENGLAPVPIQLKIRQIQCLLGILGTLHRSC